MKKLLFIISTMTIMVGANAQTMIGLGPDPYGYSIPAEFSANNQTNLAIVNENGTMAIFNNNLTQIQSFSLPQIDGNSRLGWFIIDLDDPYDVQGKVTITQTLFNNDNEYEFLVRFFDEETYNAQGGAIVSQNGAVLWTWHASGDNIGEPNIVKWGGQYYIVAMEADQEHYEVNETQNTWYRIDRQTQSISRVDNVPFNVFPTVTDRNSDITVQLEEGANAREIVVVDAMGREVKSVPVQPGQREVKVSTRGLSAGLGFVTDRKNNAVKIIVR